MRFSRRAKAAMLVVTTVLVLLLLAGPVQARHNCNPRVIPPQAKPFGHSYGEWGARYWQWAASIPKAGNPMNDLTGVNAGVGQSGKVWFLTQGGTDKEIEGGFLTTAERTITMPAGKAVFFPMAAIWEIAPSNGATEAELRYWDDWFMDHVTELTATVDGRQLHGLFAYRAKSPSLFTLWWPPGDDALGISDYLPDQPPPPADATCEGFWIMLAPLSVGHHELRWGCTSVFTMDPDGWDIILMANTTYHITVKPECRHH
jgi:hypothetical protein